jgi:hypothetical protein
MASHVETFISRAENAAQKHYYVGVSVKDEKFKFNNIKLSSYINLLCKDPEYVFLPTHCHAGNKKVLTDYLLSCGFDEASIKSVMEKSYNVYNYKNKETQINKEIEIAKKFEEDKKESQPTIQDLIKAKTLISATRAIKTKAKGGAGDTVVEEAPTEFLRTPKEKIKRSDLKARIATIPEDKYMDVTNFNAENKTGIKFIKRKLKDNLKPLSGKGSLNNVVYDFDQDGTNAISFMVALGHRKEDAEKIFKTALECAPQINTIDLTKIIIGK